MKKWEKVTGYLLWEGIKVFWDFALLDNPQLFPTCSLTTRKVYAPLKKMHTCEGVGLTWLWQALLATRSYGECLKNNLQSIFSHRIMGEGKKNSPSKVHSMWCCKCSQHSRWSLPLPLSRTQPPLCFTLSKWSFIVVYKIDFEFLECALTSNTISEGSSCECDLRLWQAKEKGLWVFWLILKRQREGLLTNSK